MKQFDSLNAPTRRALLHAGLGAAALLAHAPAAFAAAPPGFDAVARQFSRPRAGQGHFGRDLDPRDGPHRARHVRVQADAEAAGIPRADLAIHQSPRLRLAHHAGKEALRKNEALFARIEQDFGVERGTLLALWGVESAYGDPLVQQNHMRPIFPSLAALAWNEPRRRAYWETELINALKIVDRGWGTPEEMRGSWAGAMGHTQWMPEVWLNVGMDYDRDGRVSPFGKPDDALGLQRTLSGQSRQISSRRTLGL